MLTMLLKENILELAAAFPPMRSVVYFVYAYAAVEHQRRILLCRIHLIIFF
jgi:hypothetical protein